jgi:cytochrome c
MAIVLEIFHTFAKNVVYFYYTPAYLAEEIYMNKRLFIQILVATSICALTSQIVSAQDRGTFDEAKTMVNKALVHIKNVGTDVAFKDFSEDKANWTNKDIYIFALDMKGNHMAHGANSEQKGKNFWGAKDVNGKLVFQEFAAVATKGSGVVEYQWVRPGTKKIETKVAYIVKIPSSEFYIGSRALK